MDNGKDELIDIYGYQAEIYSKSYNMMGCLLDRDFVKNEVEKRRLSDIYIYGGGFLGIQLYRAITPFANVLSIVDKKGKLLIAMEGMPVIDGRSFRNQYQGETVIVTPLQYYKEIYSALREFVPDNKIIYLEEFGG